MACLDALPPIIRAFFRTMPEEDALSLSVDTESKDRQFVTALARGLQLLQAFKSGDETLSNAELRRRTGLPKPTISRLTYTLSVLGYLGSCPDTGHYRLLPHVLSLGYPVLTSLGIRQVARPMMQTLADHSGGQVAIGVRDGLDVIFVERSRDRTVVTLPLDIGSRIPIATSSMGRACLAGLEERERERLIDEIRMSGPDDWWPPIFRGIERELKRYAERGYCFSAGDWDPDVNAVGVPLTLRNGTVLAFNCGGPAARIGRDRLDYLGEKLKQLVAELAKVDSGGA